MELLEQLSFRATRAWYNSLTGQQRLKVWEIMTRYDDEWDTGAPAITQHVLDEEIMEDDFDALNPEWQQAIHKVSKTIKFMNAWQMEMMTEL